MDFPDIPELAPSKYSYSKHLIIREWNGGGYLAVAVGYVREHPEQNCIVLLKHWKTKADHWEDRRFPIRDSEDWVSIKAAIEKLWPELGDSTASSQAIDEVIKKVSSETKLLELVAKYPDLLNNLPEDVDILSLPQDQKEALKQFLATGGEIANSVINKLSQQPIRDLKHFSELLEDLKLSTINSLVTHVTGRINFIEMFEKVIHNEDSYERRGNDSVHNYLRQNMWIVNQNYAVLHDDETLKKIIEAQWQKEIEEDGENSRPDFLCMTDRLNQEEGYKKLLIIEIKRPSVKINMKHIQQVMRYKTLLQKYSGVSNPSFVCYIIGREIDELLLSNPLTKSDFFTKTYTDFIGDARKFYNDYLEIVKEEKYAF